MHAFVFVNVKAGRAKVVARQMGQVAGVRDVHACWGVPDIIAVIEVKNERALNDLVFNHIAKLPGVEHTDTHIALD
ncbi:MAG: Lrp/AsnC family transcriptional regulator [Terriglobia bacterium]